MSQPNHFSDEQREFALLFYKSLKDQNAAALERRTALIKLSLVGTFSFYAAIFSPVIGITESGYLSIMVWMPIVFNGLGLFLEFGVADASRSRGLMMDAIEEDVGVCYWAEIWQADKRFMLSRPFTASSFSFWIVMIILSAYIALVVTTGGAT